jgi:protein-disulfide isomerase
VRHDFPLPFHTWSFQGAVDARWFDTKSKRLGDEFRDAVFAAQATIQSQDDLNTFARKFAADHKLAFPFVVDPQGRLAQQVKADSDLGQSVGIQHTPTIWVVTNRTSGAPFVEVIDRSKLFELIEQAQAATGAK